MTQARPHTYVNYLPNNRLSVIAHPSVLQEETYINHCATCLEGEEDVDVGAIGHSSAGCVG